MCCKEESETCEDCKVVLGVGLGREHEDHAWPESWANADINRWTASVEDSRALWWSHHSLENVLIQDRGVWHRLESYALTTELDACGYATQKSRQCRRVNNCKVMPLHPSPALASLYSHHLRGDRRYGCVSRSTAFEMVRKWRRLRTERE
ncbi:hypothetical protein P171DRAFT_439169 [Karstenula rhodostoma CBS 690.94]|uniref:Uncharacterized protein n=1 Tax=Karstenula rhodostoma CBS 690.94 TaxID=1392251 RepID=A0A9P4PUN6_9PLEO|nr:hypothetical protein P171DRAFT_439169 [Karstenula rhodostoma CBS 690.94]